MRSGDTAARTQAPQPVSPQYRSLAVHPWSFLAPAMASTVLAAAWGRTLPEWSLVLVARALLAAVHYVEVVAHRLGERYGTLVLAVAVTISEVALLISMMLSGGESTSALARDTVFAAVMIVCNGVVGLCLLVGGLRHREIEFRVEGTSPALAVLAALATLTMVLPGDHDHHRGPDTLDLPTGVRRARTDWRACVNGTTSLAERPMTTLSRSCRILCSLRGSTISRKPGAAGRVEGRRCPAQRTLARRNVDDSKPWYYATRFRNARTPDMADRHLLTARRASMNASWQGTRQYARSSARRWIPHTDGTGLACGEAIGRGITGPRPHNLLRGRFNYRS